MKLSLDSGRVFGYNGAGELTGTMYHVLRHARSRTAAALTLLLGALTAAPAHATDSLLFSLLSVPQTFAALWTAPNVSGLLSPPLMTFTSAPPLTPWEATTEAEPLDGASLPSLSASWHTLRQADPSLNATGWRRVLNVARLGVFVLPLRDDPGERTNILLAAQAVDDATVPPGGVFSFNETVGERTPERGYQDGLMFSEGQLIRGTGGGICLVATGLYNAALQAGLPLLERHAHSGIVGYAPPGCDASIVYGAEDMRFQNTTGAPLVVKTEPKDDCVVVSLYGQTPPPGRKVWVKTTHLAYIHAPILQQPDPALPPAAAPVVAQKPRLGFDVTVERVWTAGKRILRRETVVSERRAPRPEIVHVPVPPPAPLPTVIPAPTDAGGSGLPGFATPPPVAGERGQEALPFDDALLLRGPAPAALFPSFPEMVPARRALAEGGTVGDTANGSGTRAP